MPSLAVAARLALALLLAFAASWLLLARPWPGRAGDAGPAMAISLAGPGVSCDAPSSCAVPAGGPFDVAIEVSNAPAGGYVGFQTELFYDALTYSPAPVAQEVLWPESALPLRDPLAPAPGERLVAHADASATAPPLPASAHTGPVVALSFRCPPAAAFFVVALLPFDEAGRPFGAGFALPDGAGGLAATVPAGVSGTRLLDLDGAGVEDVPVAAAVEVECRHQDPTATFTPDTPTSTPTPTPAATATPTPALAVAPGDVNCDGAVSSIDAALILQLEAALISALACPQNGDVTGDGVTNSIDAAVVLQAVAGLVEL